MHEAESAGKVLRFEQPLNERMRTLMRLEMLFGQGEFGIAGDSEWHSRVAIATLAEILELLSRGDLKSELIKELERVTSTLQPLMDNPGVDTDRLQYVIHQCERLLDRLRGHPGQLGLALRQDEFLAGIMQRSGIAGGTCAFDLPAYHYWLHRGAGQRRQALEDWYSNLDSVRQAVKLILQLIRDSALPRSHTAQDGIYQRNLERGSAFQLVCVELPGDSPWFAEISGSRHFITIRFMEQGAGAERPTQTLHDVDFILRCCAL
ncbi:MAG: cell division protein ZapD [Ectothiorhodospiraceae bacterium]|nr:cell division protein ZapD [Ectothiorhodospiraceae bacterium]